MDFVFNANGADKAEALATFETLLDQVIADVPDHAPLRGDVLTAAQNSVGLLADDPAHGVGISVECLVVEGEAGASSVSLHIGARINLQ